VDIVLLSESLDSETLEELHQLAQESGAQLELLGTGFEEGRQLQMAFGGLAAILRWSQ